MNKTKGKHSRTQTTDRGLPAGRGDGGLGERGEGVIKDKSAAPGQSRGCQGQHGEYSQPCCNSYERCRWALETFEETPGRIDIA